MVERYYVFFTHRFRDIFTFLIQTFHTLFGTKHYDDEVNVVTKKHEDDDFQYKGHTKGLKYKYNAENEDIDIFLFFLMFNNKSVPKQVHELQV